MSSGSRNSRIVDDIRRKARIVPALLLVSAAGVLGACSTCSSIRFVAGGRLPSVQLNIVFFIVLVAAVVAGLFFVFSVRALLKRVLRLVDDVVREKDSLVDNVLHDIKSPIAGISNCAQLMLAGRRDREQTCESIVSSCERLAKVIDCNIAITNNVMGLGEGRRDSIDMKRFLEDVAEERQEAAGQKGVRLSCDVPGPEFRITADFSKIDCLVCNLVDNAVRYTPSGGAVRMSAKPLAKGFWLEVSDTGVGMSEEVQARMYERFYRADPDGGERGGGLGLAMVKSVVDFYGGRIRCRSAPGKGTTFTVSLPLKPDR